jgi:tetratricopeptide (TPR) repeat protein
VAARNVVAGAGDPALMAKLEASTFQAGEMSAARAILLHALSIEPHSAAAHYNLGISLYQQMKPAEAIVCFSTAVKLKPDLAEAYFRLGLAYVAVGKEQEAEDAYKKAVEKYKKYLEENSKDAASHNTAARTLPGVIHRHFGLSRLGP